MPLWRRSRVTGCSYAPRIRPELNAYLVGEGVRVDEIGPYRRTLEQVVLEAEARA